MLSRFRDGTMRVSGVMEGSYAIGRDGRIMSVADSLKSECGHDFDEYVRRALEEPFPYDGMMPASRTVDTLWKNRRFKLYSSKNEYREGSVVSWTQANNGPLDRHTHWCIDVDMDSIGPGDAIVVHGLQSATQHNGKTGRIIKYLEDAGRYRVKLDHEKSLIAVKPQNVVVGTTTYTVNRMNVEGGGTLIPSGSSSTKKLISLEWIEPASPAIDLDEGALKFNCPTCRSIVPPLAAYDDAPAENEEECPICLETKSCRVLHCKHEVCNDCWTKWRNAASGIPVSPPQFDHKELEQAQKASFKQVEKMLPHYAGGTATKPGDSHASIVAAQQAFNAFGQQLFSELLADVDNGKAGLSTFWNKCMTFPIWFWCLEQSREFMITKFPLGALEILIIVTEERMKEIHDCLACLIPKDEMKVKERICDSFVHMLSAGICNRIGELYEEVSNYRGAIPWYERSLMHAEKRLEMDPRAHNKANCQRTVATQHCNLGLAQKYAGFYTPALEHYNESIRLGSSADVAENRETLLREMKEWTGTSGKLTPGC